jgi:hypothetical protein
MYKPVPPGDVYEASLASFHAGLQGSGATHFGTQYRITESPTQESWMDDWNESAIFLPPQSQIIVEQPEEREIERVGQLNDEQLVSEAPPEQTVERDERGTPEGTGVQLSLVGETSANLQGSSKKWTYGQ